MKRTIIIRIAVIALLMNSTFYASGEEFIVTSSEGVKDGLCVLSEGENSKIEINNKQFNASLTRVSHTEIASVDLEIVLETKESIFTIRMKEGFKIGRKENFGLLSNGVFSTMTKQGADGLTYYLKFADSQNTIRILSSIVEISQ